MHDPETVVEVVARDKFGGDSLAELCRNLVNELVAA